MRHLLIFSIGIVHLWLLQIPTFAQSLLSTPDYIQERLSEFDQTPADATQAQLTGSSDQIGTLFTPPAIEQNNILSLRLKLLLAEKRSAEALQLLETLLAEAERQTNLVQAGELRLLRRQVNIALQVQPNRIGVILPLNSSNPTVAQLAQQTLEGIRLALLQTTSPSLQEKDVNLAVGKTDNHSELSSPLQNSIQPLNWELVIRDSKLEAEATREAFRELVEEEHVIAVIGPLTRKTSEAAGKLAQEMQVPMISLSLTSSIAEIGDYVFRNNLSWEQEVETLLRYAIDYQAASRIAILYPENREGREKMKLFWHFIVQSGQEVHTIEGFPPGKKNFVTEFNKFTGMHRAVTQEEQTFLQKMKEKLSPLQDIDAIFIVAGGSTRDLKVILPYTEVYQLENVLFLGDSGWDDISLLFTVGRDTIQHLAFTSPFFRQDSRTAVTHLLNLHEQYAHQHQNYMGPSDYTAYAFDTTGILLTLLQNQQNHTHSHLQQALLRMPFYEGATGQIRFQENGEIRRRMPLLTIDKDQFQHIALERK